MNRRDFFKMLGAGVVLAPVLKAVATQPEPQLFVTERCWKTKAELEAMLSIDGAKIEAAEVFVNDLLNPNFNLDWYRKNWVPNVANVKFSTGMKGGIPIVVKDVRL